MHVGETFREAINDQCFQRRLIQRVSRPARDEHAIPVSALGKASTQEERRLCILGAIGQVAPAVGCELNLLAFEIQTEILHNEV